MKEVMNANWYNSKRDGPIANYIKGCKQNNINPGFKGSKHYQTLWDAGYLEPELTYIRMMWGDARDDEHYVVLGEREMEGVQLMAHSGKNGVHDPKDILDAEGAPFWEAQHLSRYPEPRKKTKAL